FLHAHIGRFPTDDRPVTRVRQEVQEACAKSAKSKRGFFRLTVPTGGGKTLASLRFALDHAVKHKLDRVVVAIPFTSIIEQTAGIYAGIFGEANVLAHHSAEPVETDEKEDGFDVRRKNAAENWDIPLVVTTNVRLFDSLFGNKPGQCRRLHNFARSVIVLDEPQSLPADLLEPCLDALSWLVEHAGSTVVFCTATQPAYETLSSLPAVLRKAREIVPRPARHFKVLSRVEYKYVGTLTHEEVAERLRAEPQGLCILNSRKDSLAVFKALNDENALYLSTLLCADHRREVLEEIKRRLEEGEECRVVSTQVVEAGVDIDLPYVMRSMGPLESIVQAAGRCNREGKMEGKGRVEIFDLADGRMPKGAYAAAFSTAKSFVPARLKEMDKPELHRQYYSDLFRSVRTDRLIPGPDGRKIDTVQSARKRRDFETVRREAKLIEEDTVSVVARDRDPEEVDRLLKARIPARKRFRELGRYSVSLRKREADEHLRAKLIREDVCGALIWEGSYSRKTGIAEGIYGTAQ
ncbi:MAG: CRISPR-associated helicase Cas3', partial [Proteobacteria bacterium]